LLIKKSFDKWLLLSCLAWPALGWAQSAESVCGSLANGANGPFDYRVVRGQQLTVVEQFHFNAKVEALVAGQSGELGDDLNYVLRAFPNHHRALVAMTRLAKRYKAPTVPHAAWSVECYYERALRFKPDDTTVRLLFALYLNDLKRNNEAVRQVDLAVDYGKDNAFTQYNAGMTYAELGAFDKALQQAHQAAAMGFEKPDLRAKLEANGRWKEPSPASSPAAASAPEAQATAAPASEPGR
jgi:Tfp pilus assembly protein PilF